MRGDVETIKERLDVAEVIGGYVKLEKAGVSFKARCPFHNEKTPSFYVSPLRQSYYCFGCGAKGDIFTFVEEVEGLGFKEALKFLAEKAGIEIDYRPEAAGVRSEKDRIREALEAATQFFENELKGNEVARKYLTSRGISDESIKTWRLGYAPAEWRALYTHLLSVGLSKDILIKSGLIKPVIEGAGKEPYDIFRDRLTFPLSDASGQNIAFSGRALNKETEPKYLNSPDTVLFTKSEVLYGLDKAKEKIRKKNYAVLVEGQIDLVLSHQAGVDNTVASSGTAFTQMHLERLKRLSPRIILAFDGDVAGEKAAEKSTELGISLGLEVKIARLPEGKDPADVAAKKPDDWKEILRQALPAPEHFLNRILEGEKDPRKSGKLIEKKLLPMLILLESSIERSHFISLIAKRTGIREALLWEDLKKVKVLRSVNSHALPSLAGLRRDENLPDLEPSKPSRQEQIQERLTEVRLWIKELPEEAPEMVGFKKEETELMDNLSGELLHDELSSLSVTLSQAETSKDQSGIDELTKRIQELHGKMRELEVKKEVL